jgi:hypothetical protein
MLNIIGMTLAAGLLVLAPAQNPNTNAAAGRSVTMVGCVERADQVLDTAATGATVSSLDFVLIKATDAASAAGAAGTTGTTGSTAGAATTPAVGPIYELKGETGTLNPHVGQKVEVRGTLQNAAASPASGDPAKSPSGAISVDSIRMLASTCPR